MEEHRSEDLGKQTDGVLEEQDGVLEEQIDGVLEEQDGALEEQTGSDTEPYNPDLWSEEQEASASQSMRRPRETKEVRKTCFKSHSLENVGAALQEGQNGELEDQQQQALPEEDEADEDPIDPESNNERLDWTGVMQKEFEALERFRKWQKTKEAGKANKQDHEATNDEVQDATATAGIKSQSSRRPQVNITRMDRMPTAFTVAQSLTKNGIAMSRKKQLMLLRSMQSHMKEAVQLQGLEGKDITIWTSTVKRKIMDHPDTICWVMPKPGDKMQRIRYLEHQGEILHLSATFQNIPFELMGMEGRMAWGAMGMRRAVDSPSWTQVRNDLTGRYQHARITNGFGQQEVMRTMMMKLLMDRTSEEDEMLQQFLSSNCADSTDTDIE